MRRRSCPPQRHESPDPSHHQRATHRPGRELPTWRHRPTADPPDPEHLRSSRPRPAAPPDRFRSGPPGPATTGSVWAGQRRGSVRRVFGGRRAAVATSGPPVAGTPLRPAAPQHAMGSNRSPPPVGEPTPRDAVEPIAPSGGRTVVGTAPAATSAAGAVTRRTAPGRSTRSPWASVAPAPGRGSTTVVDVAGSAWRRAAPTRSVAAQVSGERVTEPIAGEGAAEATPPSKRRTTSLAAGCSAGSPPRHCGPAATGRRCTAGVDTGSRSKSARLDSRTASSGSSSSVLPAVEADADADADPASGGGWLNRFGRGG